MAGQGASLFAFLYRMSGDVSVAEDLTQETFVRALQALSRYRPEGRVSTWLFSIAANLYKDYCRKRSARTFEPLETVVERIAAPRTASPEDRVDTDMEVLWVRRALVALPVEQRIPLVLFFYHDMSYEEIARCLVIPVGTVRSRIHNGKERMKSLLEERR